MPGYQIVGRSTLAREAGDRAALAHLVRAMERRKAQARTIPDEWIDEAARLRAAIYGSRELVPA